MNGSVLISFGDFLPSGQYSAHSKFYKIVNFVNSENQIVSLANDEKFLHANSIIIKNIELQNIDKLQIINYQLLITTCKLPITNYKFNLGKNLEFNSKLYFSIQNIETSFSEFEKKYLHLFKEKSLAFLLNPLNLLSNNSQKLSFETVMRNTFKYAYFDIITGKILSGISKFKGVGIGLTPSGDDFIAGFLYGINIIEISKSLNLNSLKSQILKTSLGNNIISNNLLILASEGLFFARLKNLIECILTNKEDEIENALEKLFEIGETSGSDILTGIISAVKIIKLTNY